ncbi:MAG: beta-ketoacyl-[acyl-carrier-protein] synthase family protein [bacterium]|nr:beta-ketoacyl-[acyl-carrier-protein] synthase family protein [bacterium]
MKRRSVVVTGLGLVTAIGQDEETVWSRLMAGETGIAPLAGFDAAGNKVQNGAEVDDGPLKESLKRRGIRMQDRAQAFVLEAAGQALEQAGLIGEKPYEPQEVATVIGTGVGTADTTFRTMQRFQELGPKGMRPSTVPNVMGNALSSGVSMHYRLTGTNQVVVSACTSSTNAIGNGFRMIRDGYVDATVCGGADAFFNPLHYAVWNNLGVLSGIEDPAAAYRAFDADRDGCLLGEGAGVLVLEEREKAEARGAVILAELLGYGESADAGHVTAPDVVGQARAMRRALADAGCEPADIDYINAHGTATTANDLCESRSIREVFGAATDATPVSSLKPFFGHLLGASGAVESIVTIMAMARQVVPANLNLDRPDPDCGIHLVGKEPQEVRIDLAMKNSFGFGGGNGVLVLRRPSAGR